MNITQAQADKLLIESSNISDYSDTKQLQYTIKKTLHCIRSNNIHNVTVRSFTLLKRNLIKLINKQ